MKPKLDLKKLCEAWRERLAEACHENQARFAEEFLQWFGWADPVPVACPGHMGSIAPVSYLLEREQYGVIAAHFMPPGSLPPPSSLQERGLDFCDATRLLCNATRVMNVRYAFATDFFRGYFYDTMTDELLLGADTPAGISQDMGEVLEQVRVEEGALDEIRRQPRSHSARMLREWMERWFEALNADWQCPEELAWLALDRLVLLRYMAERNSLKRGGWQIRQIFGEMLSAASGRGARGAGHSLVALCHELHAKWHIGLFAPEQRLDATLEQDEVSSPLLHEFCMLSRSKFQLPTILESFNYGEAAEKARVRMIPEVNEERSAYLAKQVVEGIDAARIELDLDGEGYRAIFYWFDQLLALYDRLAGEYENSLDQAQASAPAPDLFAWSEADASRPHALRDPFQHAVEQGIVLYCASPRQQRTARLLFYLHLIERYRSAKSRILRFPSIETALQPRPRMLESDRRRIFEPGVESEWEAM